MKKLTQLEAARGLASFIVLIHHFSLGFAGWIKYHGTGFLHPFAPLNLFSDGSLAVGFFFVLSGFVLPLGLYRRASFSALAAAIVKRVPRLWLPVALSILVGYLILTNGHGIWQHAGEISGSTWLQKFASAGIPAGLDPSLADALRQSVMVFLHGNDSYYNSNLWTMFPEFCGSMLVYGIVFLILATRSLNKPKLFVGLHALVFVAALLLDQDKKVAVFFSAGTLLASLYLTIPKDIRIPFPMTAALAVVFFLAASLKGPPLAYTALLAAIAAMILLLKNERLAGLLSGRAGRLLGELSFPLYLAHTLAILGPGSAVYVALAGHVPRWITLVATFGTVLSVSLAGAMALVYVDRWWVARVNAVAARAVDRAIALVHRRSLPVD